MKTKILFLFVALLIQSSLFAQKTFEGTIVYAITYEEVPADLQGMESMLPQETTYQALGKKVRIEQQVMTGKQVVMMDNENKTSDVLMDMMGQKINVYLTREEIEAEEAKASKPKITYVKEYKDIAGYKCQKVLIESDLGTLESWVTKELGNSNQNDFRDIEGMPLMYSANKDGLSMKMTAKSVKKEKLSADHFAVPEGYQRMSMQEMQQMLMGGGRGQ